MELKAVTIWSVQKDRQLLPFSHAPLFETRKGSPMLDVSLQGKVVLSPNGKRNERRNGERLG